MDENYLTNIARIRAVADALKALDQKVVFVGGAVVSLYTDLDTALEIRPTDDIDVVVELASYGNYAKMEERLRAVGFANDAEAKIICRYKIEGITVDIMPTTPEVIGFSNRWYPDGFRNSQRLEIGEGLEIDIFSLPYLIASKLEAFFIRGNHDFICSKDFEDIVYLFENVENIEFKLSEPKGKLADYLESAFANLVAHEDFNEGLYAHLHPSHATFYARKIRAIIGRLIDGAN